MTKRKAPAIKKTTSRKSKDSGSNSGLVLAIVMVMVIGLALYLKDSGNLPEFVQSLGKKEQVKKEKTRQQPTQAKKEDPKESSRQPSTSSQAAARKTPTSTPQKDKAPAEQEAPTDFNHYSYTSSFDFAWPAYTQDDLIVEHEGYTLAYEEDIEQPKWVAYRLTAINIKKNTAQRKDNFRPDPGVRTESATLNDYEGSGYDRGHLAPAADFSWSQEAMDGTFFLSNMSPQDPSFNRGIWKKLEEKVREWGVKDKELFVVTGPLVDRGAKKIGKNKVAVPQKFYKIVLDISEPEIKAIGFVMENRGSDKSIMDYVVTVDSIEKMTGLDFFPMLPDELENQLESRINKNLWK